MIARIRRSSGGKIAATTGITCAGAKEALDWLWGAGFPQYSFPLTHEFLNLPIVDAGIMAMIVSIGAWLARGAR